MRFRALLSQLAAFTVLAAAPLTSVHALSLVQAESISLSGNISYTGDAIFELDEYFAEAAYRSVESSVASGDLLTDTATDEAIAAVQSVPAPYITSASAVSRGGPRPTRRISTAAFAGDPSEGVNVSESSADGEVSRSLLITLLTPGVLDLAVNYDLRFSGSRSDEFESWEGTAGAVLSAVQQSAIDPLVLSDGITFSFTQDDVAGQGVLSETRSGFLTLQLDTTDLFVLSGGLPITFLVEFANGAYAGAADTRNMQAVPEPASLALLGIAAIAGRKRLKRLR